MTGPAVLVLGGSGQLGQAIRHHSSARAYTIHAPASVDLDVRDSAGVSAFVDQARPAFVINCAAFTAVDRAEAEPELAFAINGAGAKNVARACVASGARLIHVSTDYVFSGHGGRPYLESDATMPINVYGASKLQGEQFVAAAAPESCILRVSWLFGHSPDSFVAKILARARRNEPLRVVSDQFGSPTSADGVADVLFHLIEAPGWHGGVYHYCGRPPTTWFGFANEIVRQAATLGILPTEVGVTAIRSEELGASARRPGYSLLDSSKLNAQLGIGEDVWPDRLPDVLTRLASGRG